MIIIMDNKFLKLRKNKINILILSLFFTFMYSNIFGATSTNQIKLIKIDTSMIKDEMIAFYGTNYITKATALLDEQNKVPLLPTDKLAKTFTSANWQPTMQSPFLPISCYIDLGTNFKITHIGYYDANDVSTIEFSQGSPFHWKNFLTKKMNTYNNWIVVPLENVNTRYIQLKCQDNCNSGINEIALYGYQTGPNPVAKVVSNIKPNFGITAEKMIGINAFIDDPLNAMKVAGTIREYHDLCWEGNQDGKLQFAPSAAAGGGWNFDDYYTKLKNEGIEAFPCIQGNADWILGNNQVYENRNEKPIKRGKDPSLASSYLEHASYMYQYAARYGSKVVDSNTLKLASNQKKVSGLNLLKYFENSNEPNKDWEGKASYFSPYEFAAMCSADYDGHEGTMGKDIGIKNADPNAKLVMGGLAGSNNFVTYVELMKTWFENNRKDKKFAVDVLNFHTYAGRKSPEEAKMKEELAELVKWRNNNYPDKQIWLTEFGWDTNNNTGIVAPSKEAQANWLIRGYLASMAAGIDKSTMYMLRDACPWGYWNYSSSGLVGEKGSWAPKPSWFYVYTMKDTLKGMVYDSVVIESTNLYIYKFVSANKNSGKQCYVAWCPTSNGTKINNYKLNIGKKDKATLVNLEDDYSDGIKSNLNILNNQVTVNVSERPIFVVVSNNSDNEVFELTYSRISVDVNKIYSNSITVQNQFKHLVDEQSNVPRGFAGLLRGKFKTQFEDIWPQKIFPLTGYIDLGKTYKITHVGFYDSTGTGTMKLYAGNPSSWVKSPFVTYGLPVYNSWETVKAGITTRYIKIEKYDNADCYELGFYGYPVANVAEDSKPTILPSIDWNLEESIVGGLKRPVVTVPPIVKVSNPKIDVKTNMITTNCTDKNAIIGFQRLIDEQAQAPKNSTDKFTGKFITQFEDIWPQKIFPISGVIDLGKEYDIKNIGIYDSTGTGKLQLYSGTPNNWSKTPVLTYGLDVYNTWVVKDTNVKTRYIKIDKYDNADCYEIVFYGAVSVKQKT